MACGAAVGFIGCHSFWPTCSGRLQFQIEKEETSFCWKFLLVFDSKKKKKWNS